MNDVFLPNMYSNVAININKGINIKSLKIIIVLWIIIQISIILMDRIDAWFMPKLQRHIRKSVLENIMESFKENYKDIEISEVLSKIIKLPQIIAHFSEQIREFFVPTLMIILFANYFLLKINWQLSLIFTVNILIIFISSYTFQDYCNDSSSCKEKSGNILYGKISDIFNNILNIYTANKTNDELNGLKSEENDYEIGYRNTILCSSKFRTSFYFMNYVTLFTVLGWSYILLKRNIIDNRQIMSILTIMLILIAKMSDMSIEIRNFIFNKGSLNSIQNYLNTVIKNKKTIITKQVNSEIKDNGNVIIINNLSFKYNGTNNIFNNFSLSIKKNEKVGILGRNGSGKSTLVKILLKLLPYEGNIYYNGINLKNISRKELHSLITYIPQNQTLFNRSIYSNIIYGVEKKYSKKDIDKILTFLNIKDILQKHNDRKYLDKIVSSNDISGGQRQVIFLMRCYLRNTPIVILDEVTSALDQENKKEIDILLELIIKNKTLLMITHNKMDNMFFDRKITL